MKPALLILDAQNDFFSDENANLLAFERTMSVINEAIAHFREQQLPVAFIQHTSKHKLLHSYSWGIYEGFDHHPNDLRLNKRYPNAFWHSELEHKLKALKVDYVVVAGYLAEHCVLSTLRGAQERGFEGALLKDAVASLNNAHTDFVLQISPCVTLTEVIAWAHPPLAEK